LSSSRTQLHTGREPQSHLPWGEWKNVLLRNLAFRISIFLTTACPISLLCQIKADVIKTEVPPAIHLQNNYLRQCLPFELKLKQIAQLDNLSIVFSDTTYPPTAPTGVDLKEFPPETPDSYVIILNLDENGDSLDVRMNETKNTVRFHDYELKLVHIKDDRITLVVKQSSILPPVVEEKAVKLALKMAMEKGYAHPKAYSRKLTGDIWNISVLDEGVLDRGFDAQISAKTGQMLDVKETDR